MQPRNEGNPGSRRAYLEQQRHCAAATRNQRLAALRSLFCFIGRQVPEPIAHAAQIQGVPLRRVAPPLIPYLEKAEVDAELAVPDRATPLGRRNYALLLFLYNTGARATEAAELPVGALALDAVQLSASSARAASSGTVHSGPTRLPCSPRCSRPDRRALQTRACSSTSDSSR